VLGLLGLGKAGSGQVGNSRAILNTVYLCRLGQGSFEDQ